MTITPYKQTFSHSCLVTCFLMLLKDKYNINFTAKDEEKVLLKGMSRQYPFYVSGIPQEVFNYFKKKIIIDVDNKFFTKILAKSTKRGITVKHHKITTQHIRTLVNTSPVICHIDDNYFGDYSHASHFIIIEKATEKRFQIVDPMHGTKSWISNKKLESSILSLKKHIKMCPLLLYLE